MALSDTACRKAKLGEKDYKLADSQGLFLLVRPNGSKLWRLKYRFAQTEKQLALGSYPDVSLTAARNKRAAARALLDQGIDPSVDKRQRTAALVAEALDSFERVARAWHKIKSKALSPRYGKQVLDRLENHVFPKIGSLPLKAITPPMALEVVRAVEAKGHHDMAHRVVNHMSDVFVWAIASGIADQDPAGTIRKALAPTDAKLRPAMTKIEQARAVLKITEAMPDAHWSTLLASRLLALTAARPGVVQLAEISEFEDLDSVLPIWRVPAAKMKLTRRQKRDVTWEFVIPLSKQAVAVVKAALSVTASTRWLFTGIGGKDKPISDSTISGLYRDAGFRGIHVPHGWRATFSTIMNERAAGEDQERDRPIIDMMLAHTQEGVEPIYNRAMYMTRRRELAQTWAGLLMRGLPAPASLLPEQRPWRSREGKRDGAAPRRTARDQRG